MKFEDFQKHKEEIWKQKSDSELLAASRQLADYTEVTEQIIRAEIRRRKLFEPSNKIEFLRKYKNDKKSKVLDNSYIGNSSPIIRISKTIKLFATIGILATAIFSIFTSKDKIITGKIKMFDVGDGARFVIQENGENFYVLPPEKLNLDEVCSYTLRPNRHFREYTITSVNCRK